MSTCFAELLAGSFNLIALLIAQVNKLKSAASLVAVAHAAGACAYILKSLAPSKMLDVIRRVRAGEKGFIPR